MEPPMSSPNPLESMVALALLHERPVARGGMHPVTTAVRCTEADAQRRSASRAAKIESASTRTPVSATPRFARATTSSTAVALPLEAISWRGISCRSGR
jgi:hypothetical protein